MVIWFGKGVELFRTSMFVKIHKWFMSDQFTFSGKIWILWRRIHKVSFYPLWIQVQFGIPWLVDWLKVPTPMRAIRVRAWVEVVGSVMELFHFRVQWNARNISRATLHEYGEASSCQEANPMYEKTDDSCLLARSCQRQTRCMRKLMTACPWGKPGERYKHRWGKVRQASCWDPW